MSRRFINAVLLIVLVGLVMTIFIVRRQYPTKNVEVLPGMVTYVAYNSQSENPNYLDGKTLQPPVAGTVVRGFEPLHYKANPEDALRAGRELRSTLNPSDSVADLSRGAFVFGNICKPCHGAGGAGNGIIPQLGFPPPPSLFAENAMKMKAGQIFHIITYGQRNMPSFASQVMRADRWRVGEYIRSLQELSKKSNLAGK
jgi:mono/diheme cytochrome c family protein